MLAPIINDFKKFRDTLFACFSYRADATMELIDALSGNTDADSVVQLSLSPAFRRNYGSIREAISSFGADLLQSTRIEQCLIPYCSPPTSNRPFRLMVLDATPARRQFAKTLEDRGIIYSPNPVPGNKPITVGHQYSVMGFLPEQSVGQNFPWMLPLSVRRISTDANSIDVGLKQLDAIIPSFNQALTVSVGDTAYSRPHFIQGTQKHENLVHIARLQANRVIYHPPNPKQPKITNRRTRGHELWYGEAFNLSAPLTWQEANETQAIVFKSRKGKLLIAHIQCWNDRLMRQKNGVPLNEHPFRVIRIVITNENGEPVYKRPMWLMVVGKRRQELSLMQIWESYKKRYDIEHFFKFGKSRLLMDKFQTPDTTHEESWWQLASFAYAQLYMARQLADNLPNPWEKYLPTMKNNAKVKSPRQVQKSFLKITAMIGTPANPPKPRGKPLGRLKGAQQPRRIRLPIVIKHKRHLDKMAS